MKTTRRRTWIVRAALLLLVVAVAAVSFTVVGMKAHAASSAPLQLETIGEYGSDYVSHTSYHRGSQIELWANYYDTTGQSIGFTAHPAVYHSSYCLINVAVGYTSWSYLGMQQASWWVTIPKKAPLGTYKYWFTLIVSGYPNQTLMTTFNVVK